MLGEYATLDAAQLLGYTGGPFEVRPVFKGADGVEKFGAWVGLFVDPDADGAASDSIGPGSVNLVTGDYSLSATDADEFGLNVGRTSSSRDPRAGLVPQRERLSTAQATINADPAGNFGAGNTTLARVTDRGHTGNDSLRIDSNPGNVDSFAALGGDAGGMRLDMKAGRTYRVSGWVYVPAATGLSPAFPRGLAITGFYNKDGVYNEPSTDGNMSARLKVTDAWQYLTFDFRIPVGATQAFLRVYNGMGASGQPVFFDDFSVREVWAPLGPQWAFGTGDDAADTDYLRVERSGADTAIVHTDGGGEIWFTASGDGRWYPEVGAEGLSLTDKDGVWTLTELDGTTSVFKPQTSGGPALLETTSAPAAPGATRMVYESVDDVMRLARIVGPTEPGIDANACANATPAVGCEVTQLAYAPATTPEPAAGAVGAYPGQVSKVSVWSTTDAGVVELQDVAEFRYDELGRLVEAWDPRVTPALKTGYGYDAAGHVTSMTPAGELPWRFAYAVSAERTSPTGDLIDANPGRLQAVTRASLVEGSASQTGPDNTTTVLYGVPLTRAAGGPHDLDAAALGQWGQKGAPTDATAIFGPHAVPAVTTVTPTAPGADGYADATIHYLDASGREVNTASPVGGQGVDADLKRVGYLDTAEFDRFGNTTRILDATNRLIALGKGPTAASDLAELNLAGMTSPMRAMQLSSLSTYSADGLDLVRSVGPVRNVSTATGMRLVRLTTQNTYDEGKPDAQTYHLVTTSTTSAQPADDPDDPAKALDAVTTRSGYAPSTLGGTSGWVLKKSTSVTVGEGAGAVSSSVKYDANGRTLESRRPTVAGVADWGTRTIYYTAGANTDDASCGNKPQWAGQPCVTRPKEAIQGADAARMGTTLPTKRVEAYSRYGTAVKVTETGTGTGATKRTTTTTLDAAERTLTTAIGVTAGGQPAGAVDVVTVVYDPTSGHAVESKTTKGSVKRTLDVLGRTLSYQDVSGATASSTYDRFGQPKTYTEKDAAGGLVGSRSFTYDRAVDPRGFLTSVTDSVAGTLSATYGPDGQVLTQSMPGGVTLEIAYDATRAPMTRTYKTAAGIVANSAVTVNTKGKWASHTTTASTSSYAYDQVGRLTGVTQ